MKECSYKKEGQKKDNKTTLGVILLIVGIVLLGRNLHFIPSSIGHMLFSWPMLLIAIGLIMVSGKGKSVGGIFLIGLGGIFLWNRFMPFSPFEWKIVWPMLFILVGAVLVIIYLGNSFKEINQSRRTAQKVKFGKDKHRNVEFDIDKIEPIED